MKKITKKELKEVLRKHEDWLNGKRGGKRAVLSGFDLSKKKLGRVNLRKAILDGANAEPKSLPP